MTKILLVEDDNSLREIYGVRLRTEGYEVVEAENGEAGLAAAVSQLPDLIVSDAMMPKISGFEMLDLLKGNDKTKNIKVIMMTALSSDGQKERGEKLGAERYLVKSQVGIEDLVRTVHEVLGDKNPAENSQNPQNLQSPANVSAVFKSENSENSEISSAPQADYSAVAMPDAPLSVPTRMNPFMPTARVQAAPEIPNIPTAPITPIDPAAAVPENPQIPSAQPNSAPNSSSRLAPDFRENEKIISDSQQPSELNFDPAGAQRVIQPTGETLSPKIDIDAILSGTENSTPASSSLAFQSPNPALQSAPADAPLDETAVLSELNEASAQLKANPAPQASPISSGTPDAPEQEYFHLDS